MRLSISHSDTVNISGLLKTLLEESVQLKESHSSATQVQTMHMGPTSDAEQDPHPPTKIKNTIGGYDDLGEIGAGGMGSVRLVRDRKFNRRLAMKIIHPWLLSHNATAARFVEEAQVCAQLQHPNIVPVHDLGVLPDGRLYFTMKEIRGRSLDVIIRSVHDAVKDGKFYPTEDGWTLRRLIDAFRQVCQAVDYAHSKGVLHRDLKPENIMLGEFGEVLVVDWGIAKVVGRVDRAAEAGEFDLVSSSRGDGHATRMGQVTGTPAYMPPEQARGEIDKLNAQTDIYALGAILYEILMGQPPYDGTNLMDVLHQIKHGPPMAMVQMTLADASDTELLSDEVRTRNGLQVPEALVEACEVAMSRLQCARYASAEELGTIVQSWLEGSKKKEKAMRLVRETEGLAEQCQALKREGQQLLTEAEEGLKDIPKWAGEDVKGKHWQKECEGHSKQREMKCLEVDIEYRLQSALSHKADLEEGHEALIQRYLNAHQTAEIVRDEEACAQNELRLRHHALSLPKTNLARQKTLHYLKGVGAVSLITDVDGVDIYLDEYVPHHRRLVPKRIAHLGNQGLVEHPLKMGSYRLVLKKEGHHDLIYPVHIGRGEHWDGRDEHGVQRAVHIPRIGELRDGECFVAGGWFWCGGVSSSFKNYSRRRVWVDDFVMSKVQVTNRDYLEFLNSLVESGQEEQALKFVPRTRTSHIKGLGTMLYGRGEDGRFILVPDVDGDMWNPDWPICMVEFGYAEAYCRWKSDVSGLNYCLPTEIEWEKSARGVDGRRYPWGSGFDPSYCHMMDSHSGRRLPVVVDTYPIDESVYRIRGLAGNIQDWTSSVYKADWDEEEDHNVRVLRGGAWSLSMKFSQTQNRYFNDPGLRSNDVGFRLLRRPQTHRG